MKKQLKRIYHSGAEGEYTEGYIYLTDQEALKLLKDLRTLDFDIDAVNVELTIEGLKRKARQERKREKEHQKFLLGNENYVKGKEAIDRRLAKSLRKLKKNKEMPKMLRQIHEMALFANHARDINMLDMAFTSISYISDMKEVLKEQETRMKPIIVAEAKEGDLVESGSSKDTIKFRRYGSKIKLTKEN